jgi:hypothetical protein
MRRLLIIVAAIGLSGCEDDVRPQGGGDGVGGASAADMGPAGGDPTGGADAVASIPDVAVQTPPSSS